MGRSRLPHAVDAVRVDDSAQPAQAAARLRRIIDSALDPVVCIDEAGNVEEWNLQAERKFGWSRQEALGAPLAELIIPPRHREAHTHGLRRFLDSRESHILDRTIEVSALHRDGHEFPVELAVWAIQTPSGLLFSAFIRDIRERKAREQAERERAERALRLRDVLLGLARSQASDVRSGLREILAATAAALRTERAGYWRLGPERRSLYCDALYRLGEGECDPRAESTPLQAEDDPAYFSRLEGNQPFVSRYDGQALPRSQALSAYLSRHAIAAALDVPVWFHGRAVGTLRLEQASGAQEWSAEEVSFAVSCANLIATALQAEERRQLSEALRISEERYRSVVEHAKEGILVSQDGEVRLANPYAYELAGANAAEVAKQSIYAFVHPDDRQTVRERQQRRLRGEALTDDYAFRLLNPSGEIKWLQSKAVVIDWEGRQAILSFLTDVTERKRLESALEQTAAERETILETSVVGIVFIQHGHIRWINSILETQLLGYRRGELIAQHGEVTFESHEAWKQFLAAAVPVIANGDAYSTELIMRRKDGSLFPCAFSGRAIDHRDLERGSIWTLIDITERQRLQDVLHDTLIEREAILESAVVGIVHLQHGRIRWINAVLEQQLLGCEKNELVGQTGESCFTSRADFERVRDEFGRAVAEGRSCETETVLRSKSGETFWAQISGRATDPNNSEKGSIWVVEDITANKQAADALVARAQRLEQQREVLMELASLDEPDFDLAAGRILAASSKTLGVERVLYWTITGPPLKLQRLLLYRGSAGVIERDAHRELFNEARFQPFFAHLLSGRPVVAHRIEESPLLAPMVADHFRPLGISSALAVPVWSRGRVVGAVSHSHVGPPRQWTDDRVEFALSIAKTMSLAIEAAERHQLLTALTNSEEKYRHVVDHAAEAIVVVRGSRLQFANPKALRMIGVQDLSEVAEGSFLYAFHADEHERIRDNYLARLRGAEVENDYLVRASARLGGIEWLRVNATTISWDGKPAILAIMSDVTQEIHAQQEIKRALERERELSELKSRFVSMTSHEFRTPLATILSCAQLLEDYSERLQPEQKSELIDFVKKSVARMTEMLDDVLVIGRADSGRLECRPLPVELHAFCERLVGGVRVGIGRKHRVHFDFQAERDALAHLDEKLMRHVLGNLLSNAIKYSAEGSEVRLAVHGEPAGFCFEVIDQGIGIAAPDQARLFEAFHRGTNVGNIEGTGLGLAIVKRAVDLHGGTVTVHSALGRGTRVVVHIPKAQGVE